MKSLNGALNTESLFIRGSYKKPANVTCRFEKTKIDMDMIRYVFHYFFIDTNLYLFRINKNKTPLIFVIISKISIISPLYVTRF